MSKRVVLDAEDISFLGTLHPRHVCWIAAVSVGLKPSAMIESVDADGWHRFVKLLEKFGLCFAYRSGERTVVGLPSDKIDSFGGRGDVKGERAYLSFVRDDWQRALQGGSTHHDTNDDSTHLAPTTYKGLDVQDVCVSNHPAQLMELARSRHTGQDQRWDAKSAGKALGYPECCVESYIGLGSRGLAARHRFLKELIERGLDRSVPIEFWAVYHVPCSTSCQRSIELGRAHLQAVKGCSEGLYDSVIERLHCSHLAYSVGERFLDYAPVSSDSCEAKFSVKREMIEVAREMIGSPVEVEMGYVRRPFLYADEVYGQGELHLTRKIIGPKWIAHSAGKGVLIRGVKSAEVYLFLKSDMLFDSIKFGDTAFRPYRS